LLEDAFDEHVGGSIAVERMFVKDLNCDSQDLRIGRMLQGDTGGKISLRRGRCSGTATAFRVVKRGGRDRGTHSVWSRIGRWLLSPWQRVVGGDSNPSSVFVYNLFGQRSNFFCYCPKKGCSSCGLFLLYAPKKRCCPIIANSTTI
jgi:hypothetical protein